MEETDSFWDAYVCAKAICPTQKHLEKNIQTVGLLSNLSLNGILAFSH